MKILVPYILLARDVVDQYQLWLNTTDEEDIAYLRNLAAAYPDFIVLVEPDPNIEFNPQMMGYSIYQFFKNCITPGTVYIRLDDDIVFAEEGAIRRLAQFRIDKPQYFLVYGNIVNNAITTHIHQRMGLIDQANGTAGYHCTDEVGWRDSAFAEYTHRWFFHHYQEGQVGKYKFPRWELNVFERMSINVISWLGEEFAAFNGEVGVDEEWWLSQVKPQEMNKASCICGDAVFSHYAFFCQREHLESTNVLDVYRQICELENRDLSDADKLMYVLSVILSAPIEKIKDVSFLEHMIRLAGLFPDPSNPYGPDAAYLNKVDGLWKTPTQLAEFLVYLQRYRIETCLDVGVTNGYACAIMTAVLLRLNPGLQVTAIDSDRSWDLYATVSGLLPITYRQEGAESHASKKYDLVVLDGNHSYAAARKNFEVVGRNSKLCALHDSNDDYNRACPYMRGGMPKLWEELKAQDGQASKEFFQHPDGRNVMGIGLLVNVTEA